MPDSRARWAVALGVVVGLVLTLGLTTGARWTDDVALAGTSLHTGALDVRVDGRDLLGGYGALDLVDAVPGAAATSLLTIGNAGSVPFTYRVDVAGTDPGLFAALATRVSLGDCSGP